MPVEFIYYEQESEAIKISFCIKFQLFGICWRQGRARPGCLPSQPLAGLDAKRLNKQYHPMAVEEKRRDCVVCAKIVSVQNLSRGSKSRTNTVCVTHDQNRSAFSCITIVGKSGTILWNTGDSFSDALLSTEMGL